MHNRLKLGAAYAEARGLEREVELRCGSKVTLYMPSTVVGDGGVTGSGGYEGQSGYALKSGRPFVATLEITDTVYNPLRREGVDVDDFARNNGGLKPVKPRAAAAVRAGEGTIRSTIPTTPITTAFAWRNAADSIPQVYINVIYKPTERFRYPEIYASQYEPYSDFERLEQAICDTLVNRFGPYDGPQKLKSDSVTLNGTAKIWYIARFLDGFVLDSNIPGVRGLVMVFGEKEAKGSVESYTPSRGGMIEAFYYSIPVLRYGQWAAILTTSTNAYGAAGKAGTTSTTSTGGSNYSDLLNYYNYMQAYYGANGYYNGMYNDYYNNYMFGLYNNYNVPNQSDKVTTTTVQTGSALVHPAVVPDLHRTQGGVIGRMAQSKRTGAYHGVCSGFVCRPVSWCRGAFRSGLAGGLVGVPAPGRGAGGRGRADRMIRRVAVAAGIRASGRRISSEILQIRKIVLT